MVSEQSEPEEIRVEKETEKSGEKFFKKIEKKGWQSERNVI